MLIGKQHIDRPLSDFALGYRPQGLIGDLIAPVVQAQLVQVDALSTTDRGSGGFGSTGR